MWNDILRSFLNLVLRLFTFVGLVGSQESLAMNNVRVNIKYNSMNVLLNLNPEWSIGKVKDILSSKVNASPRKLRIIFAGKELDDKIKVEDCDISQYSIIHVVQAKDISIVPEATSSQRLLKESLINLQLSEEEKLAGCSLNKPEKAHFFVYCSSTCKDVCPGKLRVRCQACKKGTLTVSMDPTCWDDVLIPGRINGTCLGLDCNGNIAEFYFKCASHFSKEEETSVVLYLIKNNFRNVPCLSCTEVSSVVLVYPCEDGHVTCLDCFRLYCMSHLNERSFIQDEEFGYTLPCPVGCENSFIRETHHFRILGDVQYERYQRFGAEECLLQSGGVLCPQPGCGAGILPDPDCQRIVCAQYGREGCGFVFCRQCLQGYHLGPCMEEEQTTGTCKVKYTNELQGEHSKWEEASKIAIKENTKPCPKCRTPTERDGGCMHMICPRPQCKFHWCWICQNEWNRECMGDHWFG